MPNHRKAVLVEQLPATPCTEEMRVAMIEIAETQNISLAEVQRRAFALFLSSDDSKTIVGVSNSIQEVKSTFQLA